MAYNKTFNPDALPAHPNPDQAAQALADLQLKHRPLPSSPPTSAANRNNSPPGASHTSPVPAPAQQTYRPLPSQASHQYPSSAQYHPGQNQLHQSQSQHQYQQNQGQYQQSQSHYPQGPNSYNDNNHTSLASRIHSPPPADYGFGPRPNPPEQAQPHERRTSHPGNHYPSRTPRPPSPDSADLYPLFRAANVSHTGALTSAELGSALVNADYTFFDPLTIRTMMRLFSTHPQQATVTYPEFQNLWRFLAAWRELFERFDEDSSGRISMAEFSNALVAFGYRLSQPFITVIYNTFNDKGKRLDERRPSAGLGPQGMSFDLFVQACISLKRMTDVFKGYDEDRDGYVTLSFEEFLTEILRLKE